MNNVKTNRKPSLTKYTAMIAGIACLVTAAASLASTGAFDRSVKVTIDMQQLQTETGISQVYRQLKRESKRVCLGEGRIPAAGQISLACLNDQLDIFVNGVNHAGLTAYHQGQN